MSVFAGLLNQARERNLSIWASVGCSGIVKENHTIKRWRPEGFSGKLRVTEERSMAQETRHAAWQTERSFAVRLLPEAGPPTDLASGLTEFLDAFDLASEWVSREDPARDGAASLAIIETRDGVPEEVSTSASGAGRARRPHGASRLQPGDLGWCARVLRRRPQIATASARLAGRRPRAGRGAKARIASSPARAGDRRGRARTGSRCSRQIHRREGASRLGRPPVPLLLDRIRRLAVVLGRPCGSTVSPAPARIWACSLVEAAGRRAGA